MILKQVHIYRGHSMYDMDMAKPLNGFVEFQGRDDNKIQIRITDAQAHAILQICKEAIQTSVQEGLDSMQSFLIGETTTPKLEA